MAGVSVQYDESGNPSYYASVPMGEDSEGAPIYEYVKVPASAVKTETVQAPYDFETGGGGSYQQYTIPSDVYQKAIDSVTPTAIPKNYTRPEDVQKSGAFTTQPGAGENVNDFSHGQLGNIYDAINSGAYKINEDKTKMFTPYGTYSLRSIGNGLYDIPIGAKSGAYNVAIGVNDKGQAIFNKNFLDNGAVRYVGGSPGGGLTSLVRDIGPVGNIALAVATGGLSIPEQIAAQTAYNMAGGAKFEDALTRGALTTGINQGIGSLTGGADLGSTNPADYAGLGSGAGGDYGISSAGALADITPELNVGLASPAAYTPTTGGIGDLAGTDDIMTSIGGVGQMGGSLPTTEFPLGAGVSDLSGLATPETGIYPGEAVPSGIPAWDNAYVAAGGTFDPAYVAADDVAAQQAAANAVVPAGAGAGVADLAGTTAGAAGAAGLAGADLLKYAGLAGLAGLAGGLLKPNQPGAGTGGGPDQTPVGAGLSQDYKPYRYMPYAEGGITSLAEGGTAGEVDKQSLIDQAIQNIRDISGESHSFFGAQEPLTKHLAAEIDRIGPEYALRNFYQDQQGLVGFGQEGWFDQQNMGNPQYAKYQQLINAQTPKASEESFQDMVARTSGNRKLAGMYRDPTSGGGVGYALNPVTGKPDQFTYYDPSGSMLKSSILRPEDVYENAERFGINLSGMGSLAQQLQAKNVPFMPGSIYPESDYGVDIGGLAKGAGLQQMASDQDLQNQMAHYQNQINAVAPFGAVTPAVVQANRRKEIQRRYEMAKRLASKYMADGGITALAGGGYNLGGYSDGGRLLRGPGDGVSDDIPAMIGNKQPARLADGEFVVPARIVSELGNGSTEAGARKLYAMMDRIQSARKKTMGKKQFAKDTKADKQLPA